MPGVAARAVEPGVRFAVADESPILRVPLQFAAVPIGQVGQMAKRRCPGASFHVSDGLVARPDTVDPVAVVTFCARHMRILFSNWLLQDTVRVRGESPTV